MAWWQPIRDRARAAAALAAALFGWVLPATAQEPAWAPLRQPAAAPLAGMETRSGPVTVFRPAALGENERAFDLPAAMPPATSSGADWTPPFATAGPSELPCEEPLVCPPVARETDRRWTTLFTQGARTPWMSQPLSISKFAGGYGSDEVTENRLETGIGPTTGVRFGWDFAARWGVETRLGFARVSFGSPGPGQLVSHENLIYWDGTFMFYPWPDTLWRPFIFAGAGVTDVRFIDDAGRSLHQALFHVPLGFGVKRQIYGEHAFRIDISDNLLFTDIRPRQYLHGVSITAGFELRFGGRWKWLNSLPVD